MAQSYKEIPNRASGLTINRLAFCFVSFCNEGVFACFKLKINCHHTFRYGGKVSVYNDFIADCAFCEGCLNLWPF